MLFDEPSWQDELDDMSDRDRIAMVLVEDLIPVWMTVYQAECATPEQIERLIELTAESLIVYWGTGAWVEVKLKEGMIFYKHKDGREISRLLAF